MNDRTLFDVDRTTTAQCEVCGAQRQPGQTERVTPCGVDEEHAYGNYVKRDRGCLNAHDPAHAPFPEGF